MATELQAQREELDAVKVELAALQAVHDRTVDMFEQQLTRA